jgi:hypothetical protein
VTELSFRALEVTADRYAANPQLLARMRAVESTGQTVHALALRAQVMIEPQRRGYSAEEAAGVIDQFGERPRWKETLKPFLWTFASTMVGGFSGEKDFDLPIPCTYDYEVTASKYLHAVREGEVPIRLLFSGTVFTRGESGFSVEQIAWDLEAEHRLPVATWTQLMAHFYPNAGWLRLHHETIAALARYKGEHGLLTWDEVAQALLDRASESMPDEVRL